MPRLLSSTKLMLPKKNRLDTKTVDAVFKMGSFINSPSLSFKFTKKSGSTPPQISFMAPKSLIKQAVGRNRLRRQGYSILEKHINSFPVGLVGVFIFKKSPVTQQDIENDVKNVLNKIN